MTKPELLSPAGDFEKLRYACAFGADAVYAGVPKYSLRARENDFRENSLEEAIRYTHEQGKKIYLTLNIFPHNIKIESFIKTLNWMNDLKPDAVILSDPGIIMLARQNCPDIPIHLSTQANTVNWASVKFWQQQGVRRIILSRELSIKEIMEIRDKVPDIELEAFIHGAICIAYSGRCLLSNYFNHRDPNQGTCSNSCRWQYNLYTDDVKNSDTQYYLEQTDRPDELMRMNEDEHGTYIMNAKDLCTIELLKDLKDAGIDSFKIEGRTKSVYYVSVITRAYRRAIDDMMAGKDLNPENHEEMYTVANRGYTNGFLLKNPGKNGENFQHSHSDSHSREFCGIIRKYDENNKMITIAVRNRIECGDSMEIVSENGIENYTIQNIYSLEGESLPVAHGGGPDVKLAVNQNPGKFVLIRKVLKK